MTKKSTKNLPPCGGGLGENLKHVRVERLAPFAYRIKSKDIAPEDVGDNKRRGFIIEAEGETVIVPFRKAEGKRRSRYKVRESEHGELSLSAARQKITLKITLDREHDSIENFTEEFNNLVKDYVLDVLDFELKECLE